MTDEKKLWDWKSRWEHLGIQSHLIEIKHELGIKKLGGASETPNCLALKITESPIMCLDIEGHSGSVCQFHKFLSSINVELDDLFYEHTRNGGYHIFFLSESKLKNMFGLDLDGIKYDVLYKGRVFTTPSSFFNKEYTFSGRSPFTIGSINEIPKEPEWIKKFYEYVGDSIDKSEVENSSSSVSVIMAFVIEKDGTMTDIKVLRSFDKALENEAIRVLKALRIKWSPGYLDGEKVRTLYTLPIKVAF